MPIRAVLFDFDGTLADSFDAIILSVNHVRQSFGLPLLPEQEIRRYIGHGLVALMRDLCPGCDNIEAIRRYREHHAATMEAGTRLFPGVLDTLKTLQSQGIRLAVCSNKAVAFTKKLIVALGLGTVMAEVLGPEDVNDQPKPDPAMLLEACRRMGVTPAEAVYVGDMAIDVHAGRAAGMPVVLVHVGLVGDDDPRRENPDAVFERFEELIGWLKG
jgi:2-phosphoglycolate phosphatase